MQPPAPSAKEIVSRQAGLRCRQERIVERPCIVSFYRNFRPRPRLSRAHARNARPDPRCERKETAILAAACIDKGDRVFPLASARVCGAASRCTVHIRGDAPAYAILTTTPRAGEGEVHDRMPVILAAAARSAPVWTLVKLGQERRTPCALASTRHKFGFRSATQAASRPQAAWIAPLQTGGVLPAERVRRASATDREAAELIPYGHVVAASPPAPATASAPGSTQRQAAGLTVLAGHVQLPALQLAFTQSAVHAPPNLPG